MSHNSWANSDQLRHTAIKWSLEACFYFEPYPYVNKEGTQPYLVTSPGANRGQEILNGFPDKHNLGISLCSPPNPSFVTRDKILGAPHLSEAVRQ